ncbi:MAG: DinB family protein [Bacteroidia bacterium]|nr:DinB family protein [Bacteroidia bacterium]
MKRLSLFLLLIPFFGISNPTFAQESIPEEATKQLMIEDWERAKTYTLEYVDAMPADAMSYRPVEGIRSFSVQMLHISQGNVGLASNGTGAERIYADVNLEKSEQYHEKEALKKIVTECYDYVIKSIEEMDASKLDEVIERGPFKISRQAWLNKAFEHQTHHRGQCAIYFRVKGIEPPKAKLF